MGLRFTSVENRAFYKESIRTNLVIRKLRSVLEMRVNEPNACMEVIDL